MAWGQLFQHSSGKVFTSSMKAQTASEIVSSDNTSVESSISATLRAIINASNIYLGYEQSEPPPQSTRLLSSRG